MSPDHFAIHPSPVKTGRNTERPLLGRNVIVTRPAHQAEAFCAMVERAGATALRFPVIEIHDPADMADVVALVDRLEEFDIAMFNSPNAAERGLNLIRSRRGFPSTAKIAAIGTKTAQAIARFGLHAEIYPQNRFDSEALLEHPALQDVRGKRVVIFRGSGGRGLLGETLRTRGAEVVYAEVYARTRPNSFTTDALIRRFNPATDVLTLTSTEALHNFFSLIGTEAKPLFDQATLVVGCDRIASAARSCGVRSALVVAADPTDESMFDALVAWATEQSRMGK